ncbi:hypothetical protein [Pseudomonas sp. CGJS7]|uniref:hypothetical protein n=1 Tax=Pseudomonas sp. CGJS7 TaxID=3109348 RepID=UPI00300A4882
MKAMTLALAGLLGLAALQPAHAQFTIPNGPFANQQAVADWWNANNTSGAVTQIFYNGKKIYEKRNGFGPALIVKYFQCKQTNDVRSRCGHHLDAFARADWLIDQIETRNGTRPATTDSDIYLDGVLQVDDPSMNAPSGKYLITCKGDPSFREPGGNTYFIVRGWVPDFSPPYIGRCY